MSHEVALGILTHMNRAREIVWQYLRGALPYPDLLRRSRMRRRAGRLITCKRWLGADATGTDATQLALLRLLYLQQLTRSAAIERRSEDAALLARAAIETLDDLSTADGRGTLLTMPARDGATGSFGWNDDPETDGHPRHRRPRPG